MKKQFDAYFKALSEHETQRTLDFLADDFELYFTEFDFSIDKLGMVNVLGWDKGVKGRVTYENLVVTADSITGLFTERNEFLKLIGIDQIQAWVTYEFNKSGLIEKQTYTSLRGQPTFQEKLQPAIDWAKKKAPDELKKIYPESQMIFNHEMALGWLVLLKKWKNTQL